MLLMLEYICGKMSQSRALTMHIMSSSTITMARARPKPKARRWLFLKSLSPRGSVRFRSKKTMAGRSR